MGKDCGNRSCELQMSMCDCKTLNPYLESRHLERAESNRYAVRHLEDIGDLIQNQIIYS